MALADLVAFASVRYPLNEASGNALDPIGSKDLTDTNTVGAGAGPGTISWSRDFERDNIERFTRADESVYSFGDEDFTIRVLVNAESLAVGSGNGIVTKWQGGAGGREYAVDYDGSRFRFLVNDNSSSGQVLANNLGAPSTATWYLIHAWHDSVNNQIGIAVNAGTADTLSWSTGVFNGPSPLEVGSSDNVLGISWDGLITDLVFLKGAVMSSAERTEDNNSGDPKPFSSWAAAATPTLEQHSYRWKNNDGNEAAASFRGALNTPVAIGKLTPVRNRILANATGDRGSERLKLQYRKVGWADADWRDVNLP